MKMYASVMTLVTLALIFLAFAIARDTEAEPETPRAEPTFRALRMERMPGFELIEFLDRTGRNCVLIRTHAGTDQGDGVALDCGSSGEASMLKRPL